MKTILLLFGILTLTVRVYSQPDSCVIDVPAEITIGEEKNMDKLVVKASCQLQSFEISIYNRWGREVYSSNSLEESWDYSGAEVDNYMWLVKAVTLEGEELNRKGNLKIMKEVDISVE